MAGTRTDRLTQAEEQALARARASVQRATSGSGGDRRGASRRPARRRRTAGSGRSASLDVLRGLAVVASVLLLAGTAPARLPPWARPSVWDGIAAADLVLPAFLVAAGTSLAYTEARLAALPPWRRWLRILRRTVVLFGIGLGLAWLADPDPATLRWTGLLQRIGLASLLAWLLTRAPRPWQVAGVGTIVVGWGLALERWPVPGTGAPVMTPDANLAAWIDTTLMGAAHTVGPTDPLGLGTLLPATVPVVAGFWLGSWLRSRPAGPATSAAMAVAGAWLAVLAIGWGQVTPINATLWTPPYLLLTVGGVLAMMAVIHLLVDVLPLGRLIRPVRALGRNPLIAFAVPAAAVAGLSRPGGDGISAWARAYDGFFGPVFGELGGVVLGAGLLAATGWAVSALDRRDWHLRA